MTDFEKSMLFVEFLGTANTVFANYMTLIFAMVTASYFVAPRMHWAVAGMFLFVYTIAALMAGLGVIFAFSDFFGLGDWIARTSPGAASELEWLGPVASSNSGVEMSAGTPLLVALVGVSYLGSIVIFFLVRRMRSIAPPVADAGED